MDPRRLLLVLVPLVAIAAYVLFQSDPTGDGALDPDTPDVVAPEGSEAPAELEGGLALEDGSKETETRSVAPNLEPEATDATVEARRLTGIVRDPLGNAVPGARVEFLGQQASRFLDFNPFGNEQALATADANTIGAFSIDVPSVDRKGRLRVLAPGFRILQTELDELLVATGADPKADVQDVGNLDLERGAMLTGLVLDADGAPVQGARVRRSVSRGSSSAFVVELGEDEDLGGGLVREGAAKTGPDGRFEMAHEPAGPYVLTVRHEDHPRSETRGELTEGTVQDERIVLDRAATLRGVVLGLPADGSADLKVRARPVDGPEDEDGNMAVRMIGLDPGARSADVTADGTFELTGLVAGSTYEVWGVEGDANFWEDKDCTQRVEGIAGGGDVQLDFQAGARLRLRIVDAATREPIEAMNVRDSWVEGGPMAFDFGNAVRPKDYPGGVVELGPLRPPGGQQMLEIRVRAPGYRTFETTVSVTDRDDLDLGVFQLTRTSRLTFLVLDAAGNPVADAKISLFDPSSQPMLIRGMEDDEDTVEGGVFISTSVNITADGDGDGEGEAISFGGDSAPAVTGRTDEQGRCQIEAPDLQAVRLRVQADEFAPFEVDPWTVPSAGDHEETLTLSRGGRARITVLDAAGEPVAKARIEHHEGRSGRTDPFGNLELERLDPGVHHVRLAPQTASRGGMFVLAGGPQEEPDLTGWTAFEVVEGELAEVVLRKAPQAVLQGTIRQRGKPLKRAELMLVSAEEDESADAIGIEGFETGVASDRTNLRGGYAFPPVDAGTYTLVIRHEDREMAERREVVLAEGTRNLDLDLGIAIVRGRVTNEAGEPVVGARISVEPASDDGPGTQVRIVSNVFGGGDASVTTDADGRYEVVGVASERPIQVTAQTSGLVPATSDPFELSDDQERNGLDLVLETGGSIICELPESADRFRMIVATHADGESKVEPASGTEVRLEGLRAGEWTVRLAGAVSEESVEEVVQVRKGVETPVILDGEPD